MAYAYVGNRAADSGPGYEFGDGTRSVHDILRRLILEGELAPGTEVSQPELSRRLSISRTPLCEALRLLEREGLVVNTGPHKSVRISPLSMSDLDDLYSQRVLGEGLAIWLTVPVLHVADLDELEQDLKATMSGDAAAHRRFHERLRMGAGPRLREQLAQMFDHAQRYQRVALARKPDQAAVAAKLAEHEAIYEACVARDRTRARQLLVDHLAGTAIALMTAERHAPFALPAAVAMATCGDGAAPGPHSAR
jgi:DNA-binding GntR family transcriptional regulator